MPHKKPTKKRIRISEIKGSEADFLQSSGFEALEIYPGRSHDLWSMRCLNCGKISKRSLSNQLAGYGCSTCSRLGKTKLSDSEARRLMEDFFVKPDAEYPGMNKPWQSLCLICGRTVSPSLSNVLKNKSACKWCSGTEIPEEVLIKKMKAANFKPVVPFPGVRKGWRAVCLECGKESSPHYSSIARGSKCGYCANNRVSSDDAHLRLIEAKVKALEDFPGAGSKWLVKCLNCSFEFKSSLSRMERNKFGCPKCNLKHSHSKQRTPQEKAIAVMFEAELDPLEDYVRAHKAWLSLCLRCNRKVSPSFWNVQRGGGCVYCANHGIGPETPCYLYLIMNENLDALKIGIGAIGSDRLKVHLSKGWELVKLWEDFNGDSVREIERQTIKWWRAETGFRQGLPKDSMPQSGYTETIPLHRIDLKICTNFIESIIKKLALGVD